MIENIVNVFEQSRGQAGFIKKGDSWYFNEAETILVANLQKSNFGKQYYVNLAVYVKQFGEERFPKEHKCHIRIRLDAVVTDGTENIFNAEDTSVFEEERQNAVAQLMQSKAIPFLRRLATVEGIRQMVRQGELRKAMVHRLVKERLVKM